MPDPTLISKSRVPTSRVPVRQIAERGLGLLMALGLLFVFGVLAVYGGMFVYEQNRQTALDDVTRELSKLEERFEPDTINRIAEVDQGLAIARQLLSSHVNATNVLRFLQQNTLRSARYKDFSYTTNPPEIKLVVETEGFIGLKQQLEIFNAVRDVRSATFSGVKQDPDTGEVTFNLSLAFDQNLLRYYAQQ